MSATDLPADAQTTAAEHGHDAAHGDHGHDDHGHGSFLAGKGGFWPTFFSWLYTVDHKKLGVMYLCATLFMFFIGGVAALLLRIELFTPTTVNAAGEVVGHNLGWLVDGTSWTPNRLYNHLFSVHGTVMVFLFIIPAIPAALGNIFLPIMLGTKDVAFPKLNLMSLVHLSGSARIIALTAHASSGGVDTGWTFYTPYSTASRTGAT